MYTGSKRKELKKIRVETREFIVGIENSKMNQPSCGGHKEDGDRKVQS